MKLLEKLRPAPDWESPDPSTRAAAVRDLDDDDGTQQLFLELARDDADRKSVV